MYTVTVAFRADREFEFHVHADDVAGLDHAAGAGQNVGRDRRGQEALVEGAGPGGALDADRDRWAALATV